MLPVLGRDRGGAECVSDAILDCDLAEEVRGKCTRELKTVKNITVDKDSVIRLFHFRLQTIFI